MKKELIGLNRYLYTFTLKNYDLYLETKIKLQNKGVITDIYINNGYGFEFKKNIVVNV